MKWIAVIFVMQLMLSGMAENPSGEIQWEENFQPIYPSGAYPRATALADGTLLVGFDHAVEGRRSIGIVRSTDGGKTWGDYSEAAQAPSSDDLANAYPLALADGTILVAYRHHTFEKRIYRLEVCASSDKGKTWEKRGVIAAGTTGLWEPLLFELSDGTVQAYYASEENLKPEQQVEMRSSSDGGRTWGEPVIVARKKGSRDGMAGVVRLRDGSLYAVFEATDIPPYGFVVSAVRSRDDGKTWSADRELIYKPSNPVLAGWAAGAPSVVRIKGDQLVVSFQADDSVVFQKGDKYGDPAAPGYDYMRNSSFKYVTSLDNGRTWSAPVTLAGSPGNPSLWNALYVPSEGKILALASFNGRVWSKRGTLVTSISNSNPLVIQVNNHSDTSWVEMPVTCAINAGELPPSENGWILAGRDILPVQADDMDGDGKPDEIIFLASLAAGDATTYTLQANTCGIAFPARAHTGMYVKGFEGPGWESDRIAYRLYWDERNAIDIFCKRKPLLGLKGYATPGVNYHQETPWGMDVLAVGPSLGVGCYGIWMDGKIQKVSQAERSYRVVADGPLRAIMELNYDNWIVGARRFHLSARLSIMAGQRWAEIELRLRPLDNGTIPEFVAGVVKHEETTLIRDANIGILGRWGMQALGPGNKPRGSQLGMGLIAPPNRIVEIGEDEHNSYMRLQGEKKITLAGEASAVQYYIHASWIHEAGGAESAQAYEAMLRHLAQFFAQDDRCSRNH